MGVSIHIVRLTSGVGLNGDLVASEYRNAINSYFADNNLEFRFEISHIEYIDYLTPLIIKALKLTTPDGRELVGRTLDTPQRKMSLSTSGMPKGLYQIEITDVEGNVHKARFGI